MSTKLKTDTKAARIAEARKIKNQRGACLVLFDNGQADYCHPDMTDQECQVLAGRLGGRARPIIAGSKCI